MEEGKPQIATLARLAALALAGLAAWALAAGAAAHALPQVAFDAGSSSGPESLARPFLSVVLSAPATNAVSVGYRVSGGTATATVDYDLPAGRLSFAPGQVDAVIWLSVDSDWLREPDETVKVALADPAHADLGAIRTHTYTIVDDDKGPVLPLTNWVSFAAAQQSVQEGAGTARVDVVLAFAVTNAVTARYRVAGGTATGGGVDYTLADGAVTFPTGATHVAIHVPIVDDRLAETNETIQLAITNVTGGIRGSFAVAAAAPTGHVVEVVDNDVPVVQFAATNSAVGEGDGGLDLRVWLTQRSAATASVAFVATGTAATDSDYRLAASPVVFAPGATSQVLRLTVLDDSEQEADETVAVRLVSASRAALGSNLTHVVTIRDNDVDLPDVSFASLAGSAFESTPEVVVTVRLARASAQAVTVQCAAAPAGTATGLGVDYVFTNAPVAFAPGQVERAVRILVVNDAVAEADETVILKLADPQGARLGRIPAHTHWIVDNDKTPGALTLYKQDVATVDGKVLQLVGPLADTVNLRGLDADAARNLYVSDQGAHLAPGEGGILMCPSNTIRAVRIAEGLTAPSDVELTPDQRGFVVSGPAGKLTARGFGLSVRLPGLDVLGLQTLVHVFTDQGEVVKKASPDGYFHFLDILGPAQKSAAVRIVVEHGGTTRSFEDVPLGQPGAAGAPYGHRIVELQM